MCVCFEGVRLDRVRGGRQKYKRRPEVENATYQSAPLQLTKETEKGGINFPISSVLIFIHSFIHSISRSLRRGDGCRKLICANEMESFAVT